MKSPRFRFYFLHPRFWGAWLGLGVLWLLVQQPYALILQWGRLLGWLMFHLGRSRQRVARRNLELCFPEWSEAHRERVLRENFASTGTALLEMAMSWWLPKCRLRKLAHVEGIEHLERVQAEGQGAVLMALHFTTLEIGAALLGQWCTIDGMYREHANPMFDFIQRRGRERHNPDSRAIERGDVRGMLRALRKGRVIWYAPDQDYGPKQSLFAPFFGIPTATVTATSKFARLGRARVIPFTQQRLPNAAGYRLVIHPPLGGFPADSEAEDCLRINQWAEEVVRQHPEQYLWAHRRFKTRPEGEPGLYGKEIPPRVLEDRHSATCSSRDLV